MDIQLLNEIFDFYNIDFKIDSQIIESGQRTVFNGSSKESGEQQIIKICLYNKIKVGRIQREIKILNRISSHYFPRILHDSYITSERIDNFVDNLDIKQDKFLILRKSPPDPFFLTVEEYIEHIPWGKFCETLKTENDVIDFLIHIFQALSILWKNKIVHRDIKPDNILIRPELTPVIIDLGVAKSFNEGTKDFTLIGCAPFTPQFAAPEQFISDGDVTYKADQFSVGVVVYSILAGKFPYGNAREGADILLQNFKKKSIKSVTSINKNISDNLSDFIGKLLSIEPYKRFRNSEKIIAVLRSIRR